MKVGRRNEIIFQIFFVGEIFGEGDVVLEIQAQRVAGFTRADVGSRPKQCLKNGNPVVIKTVPKGRITFCKELSLSDLLQRGKFCFIRTQG